jgi:hypothetical protein
MFSIWRTITVMLVRLAQKLQEYGIDADIKELVIGHHNNKLPEDGIKTFENAEAAVDYALSRMS